MSGPIVRTGATPEFWSNWDNVFGGKKADAGKSGTSAAKKKASSKKSPTKAAGKKASATKAVKASATKKKPAKKSSKEK